MPMAGWWDFCAQPCLARMRARGELKHCPRWRSSVLPCGQFLLAAAHRQRCETVQACYEITACVMLQVGSAFSHLPSLLHLLEGTHAAQDPPPRALELLRAVLMCAVEVKLSV